MGILRDAIAQSDLRRRRDDLAQQVTELHWDLGGLAYEMAIRDHFRLDVLLRRAAVLQERDADLAEVERLLQMEEDALAHDPQAPDVPLAAGSSPGRASDLRLPPPRASMLLVLVFLGFGVLLGGAAGSRVNDTLAASRQPLRLVLPGPSASTPASPTSTASATPSSPSASEPPESEPTSTPAPAPAPTAAVRRPTAPSKTRSGSGGNSTAGQRGSKQAPAGGPGEGSPAGSAAGLPPVKHVFVIMLSDEPYAAVFGPASSTPYLSQTLERQGELLVHYDAVAHQQLADELALLSGQGPTAETAANCANYTEIAPAGSGADEQVLGSGCVYPPGTQTLAGQLSAKHLIWRAYVEGMDEAGAQAGACAHPALGQPDPTAAQGAGGGPYATFLNPFVYFASVIDSSACTAADVGLGGLQADLADSSRTPSFSYIAPDRCHDGNPTPCTPGAPAGLVPADGFLQKVVPEILGSKAYRESGLLAITVDGAPSSGEFADSSSCCGQPQFPNLAASTPPSGRSPRGGGAVGALLLSPFIKGDATSQEPYNHFSLLRTVEDLFGLAHLGYAALPGVKSFEASIFTARRAR